MEMLRKAEWTECGCFQWDERADLHALTGRRFADHRRETLVIPVPRKGGDLASIHIFNENGSLIWRLLESPRTLIEIVDGIAR
jgi:hypothetical protein